MADVRGRCGLQALAGPRAHHGNGLGPYWSWLAPRADGGGWLAPVPDADLPEPLLKRGAAVRLLPRSQKAVLACLRWWIVGAPSQVIARDAGLAEDTASAALRALVDADYARSWEEPLYWGHSVQCVHLWGANVAGRRWLDALPMLPIPVSADPEPSGHLPPEFWKHFWSGTDPACIRLPEDAELVASVLIYDSRCALAKSWALRTLPAPALRSTAELRGLSDHDRGSIRAELARRADHVED